MSRNGSALWKPNSDKNGNAVFLADQDLGANITIVDPKTGRIIATAKEDVGARGHNGGRWHYRFDSPGATYGRNFVIIGEDGQYYYIPEGGRRRDNLSQNGVATKNTREDVANGYSGWDVNSFTNLTPTGVDGGGSDSNVPGVKGRGNVAEPILLDENLNQKTQITDTQLEFTDPIETLRKIAAENNGQIDKNHIKALEQAGELSKANTQQLIDYLDTMSPYQRQLIGIENAFNQQEKLKAAETAIPGVTDMLRQELKNAQTLASGKLLTDSEDRALEQIARSAGADAAWTRGLGDDSLVGQTLSDKLSVSQRNEVMKMGQNYLTQALQNATGTLMDTPQKATLGSQIPVQPTKSISDLYTSQMNTLNQLTTMSPAEAQSSIVGQRQYQATMDYQTKVQNANFNEAYINRALEIASLNTQAMNQFNAQVMEDQQKTNASDQASQYMEYLEFAYQRGKLHESDYKRLAEAVANGTFTMSMLTSKYFTDFWKEWAKAHGTSSSASGHEETSDDDSEDADTGDNNGGPRNPDGSTGSGGVGNPQDGSGSTKSAESLASPYISPTGTRILGSSFNKNLLVQTDGSITIPRPNLDQAMISSDVKTLILEMANILEGMV